MPPHRRSVAVRHYSVATKNSPHLHHRAGGLRMALSLNSLSEKLIPALGDVLVAQHQALNELTITVRADAWPQAARVLRDSLQFEQLIDLCGVDYSGWKGGGHWSGKRFC